MNETGLSKHVWNLKDHGLDNHLSWEILSFVKKVSIICADPDTLLTKRTELISKCRHRNKFLLAYVKK